MQRSKKASKPALFIFVGIPSAGKTTLAKFIEKKLPGVRVASDEIKLALYGEGKYDIGEIFACQYQILKNLAMSGFHLISDANSAKEEQRKELFKLAKDNNRDAIVIFCKVDRDKAEQRMKSRKEKKFHSNSRQIGDYLKELEIPRGAIVIDTGLSNLSESKKLLWESIKNYGR